jgi:hypothetical protein
LHIHIRDVSASKYGAKDENMAPNYIYKWKKEFSQLLVIQKKVVYLHRCLRRI